MKNQLKICKIYKTCICILQLHILINSIRRRHMPKRHAKRKTHLLSKTEFLKAVLKAELCFHRFVQFACVAIDVFGFRLKQCASD